MWNLASPGAPADCSEYSDHRFEFGGVTARVQRPSGRPICARAMPMAGVPEQACPRVTQNKKSKEFLVFTY